MKAGIHPEYVPVVFKDASTGKTFLTRTVKTKQVENAQLLDWEDGSRYPLLIVDVTSDSHPFWTGNHRVMDTAGRVQKFERKYGTRTRPTPKQP